MLEKMSVSVGGGGYPVPRTRYAYGTLVWFISLVFVLFQFFLQLSTAQMVTGLMRDFALSAFGASVLASLYYYVYMALQTPAGMLIDRYGPRKLLSLGALGVSIGSFLFASAHSLWLACFGRLLMGASTAGAFVGALCLVRRWFPPKRFSLFTGIAETCGMLGAIIGSMFLAQLISAYGWRQSILGASVVALALSALLWIIVRDDPHGSRGYAGHRSVLKTMLRDLFYLFRHKLAWLNGLYSGLVFSVLTVFVALWGVNFLQASRHVSLVSATLLADMVFLGVAFGALFFGWLDSQFRCRRLVLVSGAFSAAALLFCLILFPQLPYAVTVIVLILTGFCTGTYVINFAIAGEYVPSLMHGASLGFTNGLSVATAPLLQPLVGLILTKAASMHHPAQPYSYFVQDYQWALLIIPLACVVAGVFGFYLPERKCR